MNWQDAEAKLQNVDNFLSIDLARVLFDTAQTLPDNALILEIGAYKGFSTIALACACVGTNKRIITIDTFRGNPSNTDLQDGANYYGDFLINLHDRGLREYVMPLIGESAGFYAGWEFKIDLLFIDGNHQLMLKDFEAFYPHLKKNGIVLIHDVRQYPDVWENIAAQMNDPRIVGENLGLGSKP